MFIVHGIGSVCDMKFRSISEVVDGFRELSEDMSQKHFQSAHLSGFILFYFIVGAKHEENETDGVKNLADQEHLSEENLFYIMVALKNAW